MASGEAPGKLLAHYQFSPSPQSPQIAAKCSLGAFLRWINVKTLVRQLLKQAWLVGTHSRLSWGNSMISVDTNFMGASSFFTGLLGSYAQVHLLLTDQIKEAISIYKKKKRIYSKLALRRWKNLFTSNTGGQMTLTIKNRVKEEHREIMQITLV